MKKCIIVSDSFKGTLSASQICAIAEETVPQFFPECEVVSIPVADGGEGTVDCFLQVFHAERVTLAVTGPLGDRVEASYARYGSTAVLEMAAAAGLPLVGTHRDAGGTTTYGFGELLRHAVENGCTELLLGLGGSATNDGGCGAAAALGVRFLNEKDESFVPVGDTLKDIVSVDISPARELLKGVTVTAMCDVTNPLCGPSGAAAVFGPQKGATPEDVVRLDAGLAHLAEVLERDTGFHGMDLPGAGAAGGMGAGCVAFFGCTLKSGIEAILDVTGFEEKLQGAELVITGEGRIDSQSVHGKVISGVAARTRRAGVPLVAIVGKIDDTAEEAYEVGVDAIFTTNRAGLPFEELPGRCERDYRSTLADVLRLLRCRI